MIFVTLVAPRGIEPLFHGWEEKAENVKKFISAVAEYEENSESPSLAKFLEQVALISDIDNWDNKSNAVTLMTLNSAKGLESPTCFIIGMEKDLCWQDMETSRFIEKMGMELLAHQQSI